VAIPPVLRVLPPESGLDPRSSIGLIRTPTVLRSAAGSRSVTRIRRKTFRGALSATADGPVEQRGEDTEHICRPDAIFDHQIPVKL
jgi:hypothetical protein